MAEPRGEQCHSSAERRNFHHKFMIIMTLLLLVHSHSRDPPSSDLIGAFWCTSSPRTQFLPAATKLWPRLCFYTCVWFCSQGGSPGRENPRQGGTPREGEPPRTRQTPPRPGRPPRDQADTSRTRQTPPDQADTPREADSRIRSTSGRYASYWNAFFFY